MNVLARRKDWLHIRAICATGGGGTQSGMLAAILLDTVHRNNRRQKMTFEEFKNRLDKATTEEVVKATYANYFKLKYDTSHHHDLYTPQVFFEFKADK